MVTWSMTSRDLERLRSWPQYVWGQISWKLLEIESWLQWSTHRKRYMGYQVVTCPITLHDLKKVKVVTQIYLEPNISKALGDGAWFHWSTNRKPIWGIKSSHDLWRHVTLKGQGRDPNMFRAQYLENGWRYRFSYVGAPIRYLIAICLSRGHMLDDITLTL